MEPGIQFDFVLLLENQDGFRLSPE